MERKKKGKEEEKTRKTTYKKKEQCFVFKNVSASMLAQQLLLLCGHNLQCTEIKIYPKRRGRKQREKEEEGWKGKPCLQ